MEHKNIEESKRRLGGSHDRFARKYMRHEAIVSDLLQFYADPIIAEYVDVNALQAAPTHGISDELKEVIMDIAFIAWLHDIRTRSQVLFALEHKSTPNLMAALQVATQAFLSIILSGRTRDTPTQRILPCRFRS